MEIALITLAVLNVASLGLIGYLGHKLYRVSADAFLASRATSAQDLAVAQNQKLAAATEIAMLQQELSKLANPDQNVYNIRAKSELKSPEGNELLTPEQYLRR